MFSQGGGRASARVIYASGPGGLPGGADRPRAPCVLTYYSCCTTDPL